MSARRNQVGATVPGDGEAFLGRTALVMGGGRGVGMAVVQRLVAGGAAVAFTYPAWTQDVAALRAACAKTPVLAILADDADSVRAAVAHTAQALGRIDILVNDCAGMHAGAAGPFDLDAFDHMVSCSIRHVFAGVQASLAHMGRGGRIITITAPLTDRPSSVGTRSATAVTALLRGLAQDLRPYGIAAHTMQADRRSDAEIASFVSRLAASASAAPPMAGSPQPSVPPAEAEADSEPAAPSPGTVPRPV